MSSQFYTSIANYYQHIFPFNQAQIEFLRNVLPYNGARVLDVGCATGELSLALTHFGFPTWGFDYDPRMIEIAQNTKEEDAMFPVFEQLDMRMINERFPKSYFNTIICFGNTLVHLQNDDDILKFVGAAHKTLAPEGKLTIQILNYEHILKNQVKSLPLIDNEYIRFERNYRITEGSHLIDFDTTLTVKSNNEEITNSVKLYALTKTKLQELLKKSGFTEFEYFGNFKSEPLLETSLPLIVVCKKEA
jgi:2-polyprenyl-3-methyl-5-hydroxy-6-metoxy-1,4-benzoquinol methylase